MNMNKRTWELEQVMNRLWSVSTVLAAEAGALGAQGRGFAIVAEEARRAAGQLEAACRGVLFDGSEIQGQPLRAIAREIAYLALNAAIEAHRLEHLGKSAAVCAEAVRDLALGMGRLLGQAPPSPGTVPRAAKPVTTVRSNQCFLQFYANGCRMVENLFFVQEVLCGGEALFGGGEGTPEQISLRGRAIPLICPPGYTPGPESAAVIVQTLWAQERKTLAVAADDLDVGAIFYTPVGRASAPPEDDPLAPYVRECWQSEDEQPIRFMDWTIL